LWNQPCSSDCYFGRNTTSLSLIDGSSRKRFDRCHEQKDQGEPQPSTQNPLATAIGTATIITEVLPNRLIVVPQQPRELRKLLPPFCWNTFPKFYKAKVRNNPTTLMSERPWKRQRAIWKRQRAIWKRQRAICKWRHSCIGTITLRRKPPPKLYLKHHKDKRKHRHSMPTSMSMPRIKSWRPANHDKANRPTVKRAWTVMDIQKQRPIDGLTRGLLR
jgi:hypothetical protein